MPHKHVPSNLPPEVDYAQEARLSTTVESKRVWSRNKARSQFAYSSCTYISSNASHGDETSERKRIDRVTEGRDKPLSLLLLLHIVISSGGRGLRGRETHGLRPEPSSSNAPGESPRTTSTRSKSRNHRAFLLVLSFPFGSRATSNQQRNKDVQALMKKNKKELPHGLLEGGRQTTPGRAGAAS